MVINNRRFGTTHRSHLQGWRIYLRRVGSLKSRKRMQGTLWLIFKF